jgi:pimeloyl-ACP methyl ester carboxylesterase
MFGTFWPSLLMLASSRGLGDDAPKAQCFDSKGVSIQYTVEGAGQPAVLIHGLFASGNLNWRLPGITQALAKDYQVITMDVRGHGGSGKPEQAEAYGVELAEDVVRLLDHLKLQKAHLVGYSMGGMIAMKLMTRHPERVQSVVLGGMGWLREGSRLQEFWNRLPERQRAATPLACAHSLGALAVTEAEVKAIRIPVTVIIGASDPVRNLYVLPLQTVRSDWPVTIIDGVGHIGCVLKPEFKEAVKKWLDHQR